MQKDPPLRGNRGKRHTTSLELCNIKLDCTSRLMGVNLALGHADLLCIVPRTLTETRQSKKGDNRIPRYSEPRVQQISTAVDQTATIPRTREFPRDPENNIPQPEKRVFSSKLQPRVTFDALKPDTRTPFNKDGENMVYVKYSRVTTFVRCPTKVVLKFRVKIEIC